MQNPLSACGKGSFRRRPTRKHICLSIGESLGRLFGAENARQCDAGCESRPSGRRRQPNDCLDPGTLLARSILERDPKQPFENQAVNAKHRRRLGRVRLHRRRCAPDAKQADDVTRPH